MWVKAVGKHVSWSTWILMFMHTVRYPLVVYTGLWSSVPGIESNNNNNQLILMWYLRHARHCSNVLTPLNLTAVLWPIFKPMVQTMTQEKAAACKWWNWTWGPGGPAWMGDLTIQLHVGHCSPALPVVVLRIRQWLGPLMSFLSQQLETIFHYFCLCLEFSLWVLQSPTSPVSPGAHL